MTLCQSWPSLRDKGHEIPIRQHHSNTHLWDDWKHVDTLAIWDWTLFWSLYQGMWTRCCTHSLVWTVRDLWLTDIGKTVRSTKLRLWLLAISASYKLEHLPLVASLGSSSHENSIMPPLSFPTMTWSVCALSYSSTPSSPGESQQNW
jgi:hypothetical protein